MYVRVQRGEAFPKMLQALNKCCQPTNRVLDKGDKTLKEFLYLVTRKRPNKKHMKI